jgi:hypothetical protein
MLLKSNELSIFGTNIGLIYFSDSSFQFMGPKNG